MSSTIDRNELSPVKRALLELRELRGELEALRRETAAAREPIAIIGAACRFPGDVSSLEAYWRLLSEGRDAITEVPKDRWDIDAFYDPDPDAPGKISTRWGGFIKGIDQFDAALFSISPREAVSMDPQQRLLLEVGWEALENAGRAGRRAAGTSTGVFVGIGTSDYLQLRAGAPDYAAIDSYMTLGTVSHSVTSGRLAYALDLQGPAMSVDTACSSSLVAVHLASEALRRSECVMALAGGVGAILAPANSISLSKARMMSADGRCKAFDARADGFVRAEGCGVVVLKRLSEALADGDRVLAVIRGSAVNQDGRSSGLTVPNGPAQEAVIRQALLSAGVSGREVGYVEAHGTGTSLGDPIEVQALGAVLGEGRGEGERLWIGSVKTNLGHLEAAAGIAGLIKVVLSLQHGELPASLHFERPNPHIAWEGMAVGVVKERMPFAGVNGKRIAGVSSFGFSGTNAHVVLEEAPQSERAVSQVERPLHVLALSAQVAPALAALAKRYERHVAEHSEQALEDVCFTANTGRAHFGERLAVVAGSREELGERLKLYRAGSQVPGVSRGEVQEPDGVKVAFLCTGQGSQYAGMGRELYETQPTFRQALERCEEGLRAHLEVPLLSVLYGEEEWLSETAYTQPALFALEYALSELWKSWGIRPHAVIGHSVGEYVAACIAGVFSLEDGLRLIAERGRLMQSLPGGGAMAAVLADEQRVEEALRASGGALEIAAYNGSANVVVSGEGQALERLLARLTAEGIESQRLSVSHAFHSSLMDPILEPFEAATKRISYAPAELRLVSNLTGTVLDFDESLDHQYWRRHLREPVRFGAGLSALRELGVTAFIELGPHPTLTGLVRAAAPGPGELAVASLRRGRGDWSQMLESVAQLYVQGAALDWQGFDRDYARRRVALPTYPFQRQRHWYTDAAPALRWREAVEEGNRQAQYVPADLALSSYAERWRCLDRLTTAASHVALLDLGAFREANTVYSLDQILSTTRILPLYRRLLGRWLDRLAGEGLVTPEAGGYSHAGARPMPEMDQCLAEARELFGDTPSVLRFVENCSRSLPDILLGRQSAVDALFPGGSFELADDLYHHWPISRYFNAIIRAIVAALARGRRGQPLRVLEIGAGTGGTSAAVLPVLAAASAEYYFTDVSELFLHRARDKFASYPFVRFGKLDIENDPKAQGFGNDYFDLVIANNVLHATRSLDSVLGHVRAAMASGAMLILFEITSHLSWLDITFGLFEGWQRFDDPARKSTPLLSAAAWQALLAKHGFTAFAGFPKAGELAELSFQQVLLAGLPADAERSRSEAVPPDALSSAEPPTQTVTSASLQPLRDRLAETPTDQRRDIVSECVREAVTAVLRIEAGAGVSKRARLMDLGFDSLLAVELRDRLARDLGLQKPLPATLVFDHPSVEAIADLVMREMDAPIEDGETQSFVAENTPSDESVVLDRIKDLSDEQMEELLLDKLKSL